MAMGEAMEAAEAALTTLRAEAMVKREMNFMLRTIDGLESFGVVWTGRLTCLEINWQIISERARLLI